MLGITFDTLKLARKLESAGFPAKQAQDASAALSETFAEWQQNMNLATRDDVQTLELSTRAEIQKLALEINRLENTTKSEISRLEAQTGQRFAEVNQRIAEKASETIKWGLGVAVAQAGLIIAILKMHG
jgi:hypothetical protein